MSISQSDVDLPLTGPELIELIGQYPTLDTLLDRDIVGKPPTYEEMVLQVRRERAARALFNIKEATAKAKKAGVEEIADGPA